MEKGSKATKPSRPTRRVFDYENAKKTLEEVFAEAEADYQAGDAVLSIYRHPVDQSLATVADMLFSSSTQSYREVLLGCALARLSDFSINIRHPYINQGTDAFNGRTLDEQVVNPFLQDRMIPCSKGPYLASFRRSVKFVPETSRGLRDKHGYRALLDFISALETAVSQDDVKLLLKYILYRFIVLREESNISLARIHRLSLEQYDIVIGSLLQIPSGGLIPVLLSVAMFETIRKCFKLDWKIEWQGINVADRASGVGGDITIKRDDSIILAVEVTERPIDRTRVVSTFNSKISIYGIEDYVFLFSTVAPIEDARAAARQYFAQGHEINFLNVKSWLIDCLGTVGPIGRNTFAEVFINLLGDRDTPAAIKVTWNDILKHLLDSTT